MTTLNIENKSFILSKEKALEAKSIWKDLSKNKKATLSHHVFYFLLISHDPELVFKKAFSPLVNSNKIQNVGGDVYFAVKQELGSLSSKNLEFKYIEPWISILLNEDEYKIKGHWSKIVEAESELINDIRKKAQLVLDFFNGKKEV